MPSIVSADLTIRGNLLGMGDIQIEGKVFGRIEAPGVMRFDADARDRTQCRDDEMWPAPGLEDTELGVFMEPEVCHGAQEIYARVQA